MVTMQNKTPQLLSYQGFAAFWQLLELNSYILATLVKPYISRLPVLLIPLILLIIHLFEIFGGHTGVTLPSVLIVLHLKEFASFSLIDPPNVLMISWQCVKSIMDKPPKKALDFLPLDRIDLTEFDSFLHAPMNVNYRSI
ncbi:hypothetical protein SELSPUOL_01873 [Selenomonas sputigena ATCC 35185]|uniref:Uncharacterized protein n=1 Tax=Selenomonas sputigena (strain ATCC 35185 / DSM 20758 / CCUG 44933 / VPI D19B-28) TaxID=546271 RepID=C9LWL8_SELS3|nr:hypothetical protein SELSPUOL_01873 [Selenomonas sputigena ATCC 35185]